MSNQYHTKEETDLLAGMDELLNGKPSLADYWKGSASQSVINSYKDSKVINV